MRERRTADGRRERGAEGAGRSSGGEVEVVRGVARGREMVALALGLGGESFQAEASICG